MRSNREHIFFDTNVCVKAAKKFDPIEWREIATAINLKYEYCVSPLTAFELIDSLIKCGDEWFDENRERLRPLVAPAITRCFAFPRRFAAGIINGLVAEARVAREWQFSDAAAMILWAEHRRDMFGNMTLPHMNGSVLLTSHLSGASEEVNATKAAFVATMEEARRKGSFVRDQIDWCRGFLVHCGGVISDAAIARVMHLFHAQYLWEVQLYQQARSTLYSFEKHDSDLIDGQQLTYLADERVVFVTEEIRLTKWIAGSHQLRRVTNLDNLLRTL